MSEYAAYWMPTTANRQFKKNPRIIVAADGCYYTDDRGRKIFDGLSGLWTCGLGHNQTKISAAICAQVKQLDYSPAFQFAHPKAFQLADQVVALMPENSRLEHVFFCSSGSEAADTSLKIARAYWRLKGHASKTRLIGRMKGYHGVNWGGTSVGGIVANRKLFGAGIETDHLAHTQLAENTFSRGIPSHGGDMADELLQLIALHDASTIAAVIVEPFSGSAGVVLPPVGYLKRLREICQQHQILLIFDEVISAFGRIGVATGAEYFAVQPDLLNFAKQITNGVVPMGGVVATSEIYETFMAAGGAEYLVELPHGYTYSAHPLACAAGLATLAALEEQDAFAQVRELAGYFENAVHSLRGVAHISDIRNCGLAAGITLTSDGNPAHRPFAAAMHCWQNGFYVRYGGDTLQLAPPFIASRAEIDSLINAVGEALSAID